MKLPAALLAILTAVLVTTTAEAVDFKSQVYPALNQKCAKCHSKAKEVKGKFDINVPDNWKKQVNFLKPEVSAVLMAVTAPDDDDDVMPPKGKGTKMTPAEVAVLKQWIQEGASFAAGGAKTAAAPASTPPAAGGAAPQKWTNAAGSEIEATFEGLEGADFVLLKVVSTGIVHKVPLANLSPASQTLAKNGGK